MYLGLERSI